MGIGDPGCDDCDPAIADYGAGKIPKEVEDRMNDTLHYSCLLTFQGARDLAEEFGDPAWSRMKASDPSWARTVCSSTKAETMPEWEPSSDDGDDGDTHSFNFSAPPGRYSLSRLAIIKELSSISLRVRFRLIKLHNRDTYSLALTILDGPARVRNFVINSISDEATQTSGERLWTACALQLSSALQWPARRLFITGVEAT
eukprot:2775573-Rhodomonas_salina.1